MSDNTTDRDPDEILEQSKEQKRHQSQPQTASSDSAESPLEEYIADVYEQLDADEVPTNLTMRDRNLAALIRGLDEANELDDVGADLRTFLGRSEVDSESRGSVLRLLVRAGLTEVRPDLMDKGEQAYELYQDQQDTKF